MCRCSDTGESLHDYKDFINGFGLQIMTKPGLRGLRAMPFPKFVIVAQLRTGGSDNL